MDPFTLALLGSTATGVLGGVMGSSAANRAASTQGNAASTAGLLNMIGQQQAQDRALQALQQSQARAEGVGREFYQKGVDYMQPYYGAGVGATNQLASLFGQGGAYTQQPTLAELQMDPGYDFRFGQGMRGVNASAAANAGLQSGAALKAATRFGQEAGSQEYQNAYNRFMANRAQAVQGLQNLAGTGSNMATTGASGAFNTGNTIAGGILNSGQNIAATTGVNALTPYTSGLENAASARASGYMGSTSALQSALNTPVNAMMAYGMADRFAPQNRTSTYAPNTNFNRTYAPGFTPGFQGAPTFGAPGF